MVDFEDNSIPILNEELRQMREESESTDTTVDALDVRVTALESTWTDYGATSTIVGWSTLEIKQICVKKVGTTVYVMYYLDGSVSNSTTITFTLPYNASTTCSAIRSSIPWAYDNGAIKLTSGAAHLTASSNVVTCYSQANQLGWTAANRKVVGGQFNYESE